MVLDSGRRCVCGASVYEASVYEASVYETSDHEIPYSSSSS